MKSDYPTLPAPLALRPDPPRPVLTRYSPQPSPRPQAALEARRRAAEADDRERRRRDQTAIVARLHLADTLAGEKEVCEPVHQRIRQLARPSLHDRVVAGLGPAGVVLGVGATVTRLVRIETWPMKTQALAGATLVLTSLVVAERSGDRRLADERDKCQAQLSRSRATVREARRGYLTALIDTDAFDGALAELAEPQFRGVDISVLLR